MVSDKFGHPLSQNKGDKFVYTPSTREKKKSSRSPASVSEVETQDEIPTRNRTMFWLMLILSGLGTLSYRLFNRKG
jgi:hypothetical protein